MQKEFLKNYRSFIAFIIGTLLAWRAIEIVKDLNQELIPHVLLIWGGYMGAYLGKNYAQSKIKGEKNNGNKEEKTDRST